MGVLSGVDIGIIVASILLVVVVNCVFFVHQRSCRHDDSALEFFLAGRRSPWFLIAASLVASNIGTEHFVGQAGAAASKGLSLVLYEWISPFLILALGWIFAPVYIKAKLVTIPQLLEDRFNKYCRILYVFVMLILYVLAKIGTSIYAGVVLFDVVLGWNMWVTVPVIILSTMVYTTIGGLKAVMLTDSIQLLIFVVGGIAGSITSFNLIGGMHGLHEKLDQVGLGYFFHILKPLDDRDYPSLAVFLGVPVLSIAYWCVDQEMAQRVLAGKNLNEVRLGTSCASLMKILPPFITIFPGVIARVLFELCIQDPTHERFNEWCSSNLSETKKADYAYPLLIVNNFPTGIKGLMIASFLAALISSLSSVFNSASTVFTYDIYNRLLMPEGGKLSSDQMTMVGRIITAVIAILAICYLPVIDALDRGLYVIGYTALSHLAPSISAVFVAGIFLRRVNANGATIGFLLGIVLGLLRFGLYLAFQDSCDEDCKGRQQVLTGRNWFVCLNHHYFGILIFLFSLITMLIVSLWYPAPNQESIQNFMFSLKDLSPLKKEDLQDSETQPLIENRQERGSRNWLWIPNNTMHWLAVFTSITAVCAVCTLIIIFR